MKIVYTRGWWWFNHLLSCSQLFVTTWTVACQAPLSMDSPGKNTGVGCHFLLQQSKYQKMWIIGGYLDGCLSELDINSLRENGDPLDYCQTNQSAFQFHLKVFLFRLAKPKFLPHIGALSLSCTHTHKLASTYKFCIHDFSNWNHQFFRKVKS